MCVCSLHLSDVLVLLRLESQFNEDLLQLLVTVVDDELLKTVPLKRKKPSNHLHVLISLHLRLNSLTPPSSPPPSPPLPPHPLHLNSLPPPHSSLLTPSLPSPPSSPPPSQFPLTSSLLPPHPLPPLPSLLTLITLLPSSFHHTHTSNISKP